MALSLPDLVELTASALYAAAALDHNKRDEAPWPPYEDIAAQSRVPYQKQAERLLDLNLVLVPLGRLQHMEQTLLELDQENRRLRASKAKSSSSKKEPATHE